MRVNDRAHDLEGREPRGDAALDDALEALGPSPAGRGRVTLIVLRTAGEGRQTPDRAELCPERGVVGDRWFLSPERSLETQVTLMNARVLEVACAGRARPEQAGDNLVVDLELSEAALGVGARLRAGTALLEVTAKPHTGCAKFSARFGSEVLRWANNAVGRSQRRRGVHCRVVEAGVVEPGSPVEVLGA
jgi:hypothetical protein